MTQLTMPGQYRLLRATLVTMTGVAQELSGFIPTFSIEQSIDLDSLRGVAEVYDGVGILESLPIRGEEDFTIVVSDVLDNEITYEMKLYKVTDVEVKDTNDLLTYKIHFVSKSRFDASFRRIIEPFNSTISDIATEIFERYYPIGSKDIIVEPTEGNFRCIIPNYTPIQAMNFLISRAYSERSTSCSFRFFETSENFFFASDEFLIRRALEGETPIKEFGMSDAIDRSGDSFIDQMKNIIEFQNTARVNSISDLTAGAYRSHVIEIDLLAGRVNLPGVSELHSYSYTNQGQNYTTTSGMGGGVDPHSPEFVSAYFTQENERRYIVVKDYADDSGEFQIRGNQFLPQIVANRTAYRHHLNNIIVNMKTHGRLDINAGDVVNLSIPNFYTTSTLERNAQLSGNYLVSDVKQIFVNDVHQTAVKLLKYDWSA